MVLPSLEGKESLANDRLYSYKTSNSCRRCFSLYPVFGEQSTVQIVPCTFLYANASLMLTLFYCSHWYLLYTVLEL